MSSYEDLKELSAEAGKMLLDSKKGKSIPLSAWQRKCEIVISRLFGEDSREFKNFRDIYFSPLIFTDATSDYEIIESQTDGLTQAIDLLNFLAGDNIGDDPNMNEEKDTVFIVHGHDEGLKYKTAILLNKLGLKYIILHEEKNLGNTIIEKLERCGAKAKAAVVLFTPDDFGQAKTEEERQKRARQNVVFEAGYFIGLLGRNRVICVVSDNSIELPGDLSGIVYTDPHAEFDIAKELKAMGFEIDANKLI